LAKRKPQREEIRGEEVIFWVSGAKVPIFRTKFAKGSAENTGA
jgi:hypothetical protein